MGTTVTGTMSAPLRNAKDTIEWFAGKYLYDDPSVVHISVRQEPLGEPFSEILHVNIDRLYEN